MIERERASGATSDRQLLIELLVGSVFCVLPAVLTGRFTSETAATGMLLASVIVVPSEIVRHFGIPQWLQVWPGRAAAPRQTEAKAAAAAWEATEAGEAFSRALAEIAASVRESLGGHALRQFQAALLETNSRLADGARQAMNVQEEMRRLTEQRDVMLREAMERMTQVLERGLQELARSSTAAFVYGAGGTRMPSEIPASGILRRPDMGWTVPVIKTHPYIVTFSAAEEVVARLSIDWAHVETYRAHVETYWVHAVGSPAWEAAYQKTREEVFKRRLRIYTTVSGTWTRRELHP